MTARRNQAPVPVSRSLSTPRPGSAFLNRRVLSCFDVMHVSRANSNIVMADDEMKYSVRQPVTSMICAIDKQVILGVVAVERAVFGDFPLRVMAF